MDLSLLYNPATESMNVIQLGLYGIVFTFLMVTLFDTTGTMLAVATQAGLVKNGKLLRAKEALLADVRKSGNYARFIDETKYRLSHEKTIDLLVNSAKVK